MSESWKVANRYQPLKIDDGIKQNKEWFRVNADTDTFDIVSLLVMALPDHDCEVIDPVIGNDLISGEPPAGINVIPGDKVGFTIVCEKEIKWKIIDTLKFLLSLNGMYREQYDEMSSLQFTVLLLNDGVKIRYRFE